MLPRHGLWRQVVEMWMGEEQPKGDEQCDPSDFSVSEVSSSFAFSGFTQSAFEVPNNRKTKQANKKNILVVSFSFVFFLFREVVSSFTCKKDSGLIQAKKVLSNLHMPCIPK